QKLEKARREEAVEKQEEAIRELNEAKKELERILKQLRDEEAERTLAELEQRFRDMLKHQIEVYEGTLRLDKIPSTKRTRDHGIESARLGQKESLITLEADKALELLKEEGSAVALPEAIRQVRDDMAQVADRLKQAKVDLITQGVEEDIIQALQEI